MNDKTIQAQGGLYTPEELASAYAERGDRIEELTRSNRRLEIRVGELEEVADAVTVLFNWANKDNAQLESDLEGRLEEVRSDLDQLESEVNEALGRIRDAAAELASV